jgi:uncharacterized protein (TIGR02271 family)
MNNYASVLPGARVRTQEGFIGTVERLDQRSARGASEPDRMVVRSEDGHWRYSIPLMFVTTVTQGTFHPLVQISIHADELPHYISEEVPYQEGSFANDTTVVMDRNSPPTDGRAPDEETVLRMPVAHEELVIHKQPIVRGKVSVHKRVEKQEQRVVLSVYHEEAIVEHIAPEEYDGLPPANPNEVIVPVIEERLVVMKQSVIREYIRVRKQLVRTEKEVRGKMRREVVEITEERDVANQDKAPILLRETPLANGTGSGPRP